MGHDHESDYCRSVDGVVQFSMFAQCVDSLLTGGGRDTTRAFDPRLKVSVVRLILKLKDPLRILDVFIVIKSVYRRKALFCV